jgi:CDP-glucose 4,6-dehydratase
MKAFGDVFRGTRVLVTGDTGFKGSWLATWLRELGADVTGFGLTPPTTPAHYDLIQATALWRHIDGDIRDLSAVERAFGECRPDVVFHLAAQAIVLTSYDRPKETFDTNVGGTVNVLEALRAHERVRACVVITSDKCYENKEHFWGYREIDALGGIDPYSASKGAAEIAVSSYRRSFLPTGADRPARGLASARAGNVIGGGDWAAARIVPDCVRALSKGEPIHVRNPRSTRPWQHVLNPLSGYLLLAQRLLEDPAHFSDAWNFGPADPTHMPVAEVVDRFIAAWGSGSRISPDTGQPCGAHEDRTLRLAIEKAVALLRWRPVLDTAAAIEWSAEWYKKWHVKADMRPITLGMIHRYTELAAEQKQVWAGG